MQNKTQIIAYGIKSGFWVIVTFILTALSACTLKADFMNVHDINSIISNANIEKNEKSVLK